MSWFRGTGETVLLKHANRQKRRWRRSALNTPVRILRGTLLIDGFGIKVSEGGMYFFAAANLPIGETIQVEFRNPSSQKLVRVFGAVRSRAVYLYGLEFTPSGFSHPPGSPQPMPWSSPVKLPD
jgi:hypothetical protein